MINGAEWLYSNLENMRRSIKTKPRDITIEAMEYIQDLKGDDWNVGGGFMCEGNAFIFGTDKEGRFANLLLALFIKEDIDLSIYKLCDEILELHIVTPTSGKELTSTKQLEIKVDRLVHNVKYISSYTGEKTSLAPLVNLVDMRNQSTHFTKDFLESILLSKPLSNTVLSEILKQYNKSKLVADFLRYHINKTKEFEYIGSYLDNNIQTIGYLSGRLFATLEQIVKLSENGEGLAISYSRFTASPLLFLPKVSAIVKKYTYTILHLGKQVYLKKLADNLLANIKQNIGEKNHLTDNEQAIFTIGYNHQQEYFEDDFTKRFSSTVIKKETNRYSEKQVTI